MYRTVCGFVLIFDFTKLKSTKIALCTGLNNSIQIIWTKSRSRPVAHGQVKQPAAVSALQAILIIITCIIIIIINKYINELINK